MKGTDKVTGVMAAPKCTTNALEMLKGYGYSWAEVRPPKRFERHDKGQKGLGEF